jgi:hypothetical protein
MRDALLFGAPVIVKVESSDLPDELHKAGLIKAGLLGTGIFLPKQFFPPILPPFLEIPLLRHINERNVIEYMFIFC